MRPTAVRSMIAVPKRPSMFWIQGRPRRIRRSPKWQRNFTSQRGQQTTDGGFGVLEPQIGPGELTA